MSTLRTDTLQTTDSLFTIQVNQLAGLTQLGSSDPSLGTSLVKGSVRYVNTIADLQALPANANETVVVLGYMQVGDAGGGIFKSDLTDTTTPANGGTVFVTAGNIRRKRVVERNIITPEMFGAFPEGSAFVTADCSSKFLAMWATPYTIMGKGEWYKVSRIKPTTTNSKVMSGVWFRSIGWVGAVGPQSDQSVLDFDGTSVAKGNYYFDNVRVDGSRQLFTNINILGGEDGKLHAWRFVGDIQNVFMRNCRGINAGNAGLVTHHPTPSATVVEYKLQNFVLEFCEFTGNREHGWFGDSIKNFRVSHCTFTGNGLDIDAGQPLVHGLRGATVNSAGADRYFGGPWDIEGYAVGSGVSDIYIDQCNCTGNAIGAQLVDTTPSNAAGFSPRTNIQIRGGFYDSGLATVYLNPEGKFPIFIQGNFVSGAKPYADIVIDAARLGGSPYFRGVSKLRVTPSFTNAVTKCAFVYNCEYWTVAGPCLNNTIDLGGQNSPAQITSTKTSGPAGAAFTPTQALSECFLDGSYEQILTGTITGAVTGSGPLKYSLTAPSGYGIRNIISTSRSSTLPTVNSNEVSTGVGTVWFDTSANDNLLVKIVCRVVPIL